MGRSSSSSAGGRKTALPQHLGHISLHKYHPIIHTTTRNNCLLFKGQLRRVQICSSSSSSSILFYYSPLTSLLMQILNTTTNNRCCCRCWTNGVDSGKHRGLFCTHAYKLFFCITRHYWVKVDLLPSNHSNDKQQQQHHLAKQIPFPFDDPNRTLHLSLDWDAAAAAAAAAVCSRLIAANNLIPTEEETLFCACCCKCHMWTGWLFVNDRVLGEEYKYSPLPQQLIESWLTGFLLEKCRGEMSI